MASREHAGLYLPYMVGHPALQAFRQDPRFRQLLRSARLDPYY